ncbi:MAG: phosphodiester glycosidase family protein [Anaerolineae bacterium]|nr:phosphodiester glycosidase family protein [Anaerolineae bacterium]
MSNEEIVVNTGALIATVLFALLLVAILRVRRRRVVAALVMILTLLTAGIAAGCFWYGHRPLPSPTHEQLFPGVDYVREVRANPRPLVIHIVTIDLTTPGLEFLVTPGTPGEDLPARTVSEFLDEYDLQLAINGGFFDPWWDRAPWDYYPHPGDPVHPISGVYASRGTIYWQDELTRDVLYISSDHQVSFGVSSGDIFDAITGYQFLLVNGENIIEAIDLPDKALHPRTAVGLDVSGEKLILMIVDGRQPNYSEGVTLSELAELLRECGAYHALNVDGGGSSTLVVAGVDGQPRVLNSPIHTRIPGRERPVATHLGVYITGR